MNCSSPNPQEPVTWRSKITLPFVNNSFNIAEAMKLDEIDGFELQNDSAFDDSVVAFFKRDTLHFEDERKTFLLREETRSWVLGPVLLQGFEPLNADFPLSPLSPGGGSLPQDIPLELSDQKSVPHFYQATLDSTSSPLGFKITNQSKAVQIGDLVVYLMDGSHILSHSQKLENLPPGGNAALDVPLAGITLKNPLNVRLKGVIRSASTLGQGDSLKVFFSLNGLACSSVEASDSVLQLIDEHSYEFALLERGMNADYLDIRTLAMDLSIRNQSGVSLNIKGMLENYWEIEYCKNKKLETIGQVAKDVNQNKRQSWLTDFSIPADTWENAKSQTLSMGSGRLFGVWKPDSNLSYAKMRFQPYIHAKGRRVHLEKSDRVEIFFKPSQLNLLRALMRFKQPKAGKDASRTIGIDLPWNPSIKESLRGSIVFYSTQVVMDMQVGLPIGYSISQFDLQYLIYSPRSPNQKDSILKAFTDVKSGQKQSLTQSLNKQFNQLNDTLVLEYKTIIPSGATISLHSPFIFTPADTPAFSLSTECIYNVKLAFDWSLKRSVQIVLNNSEWPLPSVLDRLLSAGNKRVQLELLLESDSHLEMKLFALAASRQYRDKLYGLPDSNVSSSILEKPEGRNFIALFGKKGVLLPARGEQQRQAIFLEEEELEKLASSDTAFVRWQLSIPKAGRGQLKPRDFIDLQSFLTLEADLDMEILLD